MSIPPDLYYDEVEARKYASSSRMINVQRALSNRAIELLELPEGRPSYILDVGCGSGLSGLVLEEAGHHWVGCDISGSMLDVANQRENEKGDLIKNDIGQGLPFRPGTFDGVISISALQWLFVAESDQQNPIYRLKRFFSSLHRILKKDARAVLQFYPETSEQAEKIVLSACKAGFTGGVVVDYPNSSMAKKHYLCLSFERTYKVPNAIGTKVAESLQVPSHGIKEDMQVREINDDHEDLEAANLLLQQLHLEPVVPIEYTCRYSVGTSVSTMFGVGIVTNFRAHDGIYEILVGWECHESEPCEKRSSSSLISASAALTTSIASTAELAIDINAAEEEIEKGNKEAEQKKQHKLIGEGDFNSAVHLAQQFSSSGKSDNLGGKSYGGIKMYCTEAAIYF